MCRSAEGEVRRYGGDEALRGHTSALIGLKEGRGVCVCLCVRSGRSEVRVYA